MHEFKNYMEVRQDVSGGLECGSQLKLWLGFLMTDRSEARRRSIVSRSAASAADGGRKGEGKKNKNRQGIKETKTQIVGDWGDRPGDEMMNIVDFSHRVFCFSF